MSETSSILSDRLVSAGPQPVRRSASRARARRMAGFGLLAAAEVISIVLSLAFVLLVAGAALGQQPVLGTAQHVAWPACVLAVLVANFCLGLHEVTGRSAVERFRLRVWSAVIQPFLGLVVLGMVETIHVHALAALMAAAALWLPLGLLAETLVLRWLVAHMSWGLRALLIGDAAATAAVASFLVKHPEIGLRPVGFCSPAELGAPAAARWHAGGLADLAIVAPSANVASLDLASLPFRRILVMTEVMGLPSLGLRSRALGNVPALEFNNPLQEPDHLQAKRLLDILLGVPLLALAAPIIGLLAIAIVIESPGPVFYTQRRVGWNGKPLKMLKLRSMYVDAEARLQDLLRSDPAAQAEWTRCVKLSRDPRILPVVGKFMRKTSLDELPQLWNVVRGDMSVVGPRPFPSYHLDLFDAEFQALRASVRPGLTGLWQVSERSDADLQQQQVLDTFYIRNRSLWFDLYIAFLTVPAVLIPRGAR